LEYQKSAPKIFLNSRLEGFWKKKNFHMKFCLIFVIIFILIFKICRGPHFSYPLLGVRKSTLSVSYYLNGSWKTTFKGTFKIKPLEFDSFLCLSNSGFSSEKNKFGRQSAPLYNPPFKLWGESKLFCFLPTSSDDFPKWLKAFIWGHKRFLTYMINGIPVEIGAGCPGYTKYFNV
jgi:hypothetical protein